MGISLGNIIVIYIRIGDHWLIDYIQIDYEFAVVLGIAVRSKGRLFTRTNLVNPTVCNIDQSLEYAGRVVHSLIDHHLDATLSNLQRFYERIVL